MKDKNLELPLWLGFSLCAMLLALLVAAPTLVAVRMSRWEGFAAAVAAMPAWRCIPGPIPVQPMGRPRRDCREMLNGMMWSYREGTMRDLPRGHGPVEMALEVKRRHRRAACVSWRPRRMPAPLCTHGTLAEPLCRS